MKDRYHKIHDLDVPDEELKPFGDVKAPPPSGDDAKNRFQRHDDEVRKQRASGTAFDERVAERERQRAEWTHRTDVPTTTSGIRSTPEIEELRRKVEAERVAAREPAPGPATIDTTVVLAVVRLWRTDTESGRSFPDLPFNVESLSNALQTLLAAGATMNLDLVERAYQLCLENNHIDHARRDADGSVVRVRGGRFLAPPTIFPKHTWPDEAAQLAAKALEREIARATDEVAAAKAKPFDELQRETRAQFRSPKPGETT